jgi:dTDP-glucose 4,6-dehydratase
MNLKGAKVLVTGGGGFIGSHLVERLVEIGAHVRALVKYNSLFNRGMLEKIPREIFTNVEILQGDLRESDSIRDALKGIEGVFHLGAMVSVPYSLKNPIDVVENNVMGTANLLRFCLDENIHSLVHMSSCEVYGTAQYVPMDENHPLAAHSPYAASKIAAEKLVESFVFSYGLPAVVVRPFNTYGPRQSTRAIIPSIIVQALSRPVINIGNLTPTRDFNFVSDIVNGLILAGQVDLAVMQVINLGSNRETSVEQLVKEILRILNREQIKIHQSSERLRPEKSEVYRLLADNRKASRVLGWSPTISLEAGLEETIRWMKENLAEFKNRLSFL